MKAGDSSRLVALLHGPDRTGLVALVSHWIYSRGGNILHADHHRDDQADVLFQRVEWIPRTSSVEEEQEEFETYARMELGLEVQIDRGGRRPKVAVFVSKQGHCFHDLLVSWKAGELPCEVACVISNHDVWEDACRYYGIPCHVVPVSAQTREEAEDRQLAILKEAGVELVVMARYMQILSGRFLEAFKHPVINIHHSFLPAFAGGKPYHQAFARGVKLIGATAHYATAVLDDGPIIQQDVIRVSHRHSVADLIRKGRHLEKMVLNQAVKWHLDRRVLAYGRKTVVFD